MNRLQFQEELFVGETAVFTGKPKRRDSLSDFGANMMH